VFSLKGNGVRLRQLRPCFECKEFCIHREKGQSFRAGNVRACPHCQSICIERGSSYQGIVWIAGWGELLGRCGFLMILRRLLFATRRSPHEGYLALPQVRCSFQGHMDDGPL